jgi:uncharacterized damage-inducible protein DinB
MQRVLSWLEDQLHRSFDGSAWHGPSVTEALNGVDAAQAAARPIAGAHSIWELVLHLGGTYRLVLRRLDGSTAQLTKDEDWPAVPDATEGNWRGAVDALRALNTELRVAVAAFPADRLSEPLIADPPYSAFTQFIGMTQHDLYHAGQIVLLKRALDAQLSTAA